MSATILYINYHADEEKHRRKLDGIRRFARMREWTVTSVPPDESHPSCIRSLLSRLRPSGCIVEYSRPRKALAPPLFAGVPVVWLDPSAPLTWRGAATVVCDNAAVARTAFRELSSGLPTCYAAVPSHGMQHWSTERIDAFRALCDEAGVPCHVFSGIVVRPGHVDDDLVRRRRRLAAWIATLPPRCAIFTANDYSAQDVAIAAREIGRSIPRELSLLGADGWMDDTGAGILPRVSSIQLDFELAGFVAARLLAEEMTDGGSAANDGALCANDSAANAANDGGAARQLTNDKEPRHSSMPPKAASHCTEGASHCAASPRPSLRPKGAAFGPLCVLRRDSTRGRGRREPLILEAVEIIRREATGGLTAAQLAARVPGSRKHFERRFREAMGHSVLDEILHVRLQAVMDLLSQPEPPIGAIADFCGFGSQVELRIVFRSRTGMSMRQWRKVHLGQALRR